MIALIGMLALAEALFDPSIGGAAKWGLLLLLLLVPVYQIFFRSQTTRKGYERRIDRIPRVLSVDMDGVRCEDRAGMFQFRPWPAYQSWREGSNVFVLRASERLSNIVPKRGLTSEQVDELRVMLAMHMPDCA